MYHQVPMFSKHFTHRFFMIGLLVSTALACLPLTAEPIELPTEIPLNAASVTIDLWNADVDVLTDPNARATLRARPATDEPAEAHLDQTVTDGVLTIHRPAGDSLPTEDRDHIRLKVDIVIGAEQDVHLMGRDLRVTTREIRHPGVTAPRPLKLTLEASELNMNGGRDATIETHQTSTWLTDTRGQLTLNLKSGTVELRDHQGDVKLETTEAEATLVDFEGKLEPLMTGGSLDARGGSGSINGRADDAIVLLGTWHGPVTLAGDSSTVEVRQTQGKVDLTLTDSELDLDLTTNEHRLASLTLHGGRARAQISAPCEVRVEGDRQGSHERIRVSGCGLQLPGQPATGPGRPLQGENRPMTLTITTDPDADLEVEGQ